MSYARGDDDEEPDEGDEEVPQSVAELAQAPVPNALRGIRACKRCGLLKTLDQFLADGCENCPFLDMVRMSERMNRRYEIVPSSIFLIFFEFIIL